MNRKGIVLSGLIYALLAFFLLLVIGLLAVLWYRQNAIDELSRDANAIYDDPYIPEDIDTAEFVYIGDYQTYIVPKTGNYKIELWGANGGGAAGNGGYTSGEMYLDAADVLYVYVGEEGKTGSKGIAATAAVGKGAAETFNGGGAGGDAGGGSYPYENYRGGSSGGGATDIRLSKQNKYRYIRDYINGSTSNANNHWVEIEVYDRNNVNIALNKPVISSTPSNPDRPLTWVTDGVIDTTYWTSHPSGLQWVEIDLGAEYEIFKVVVRHYYGDSRIYNESKTVLYNSDRSIADVVFDSAVSGKYAESAEGKTSYDLSLKSRIMVAGGGGGAKESAVDYDNDKGNAGGIVGEKGAVETFLVGKPIYEADVLKRGIGGTQTSGYLFGYGGKGDNSGTSHYCNGHNGGGGGYYGGTGGLQTGGNCHSMGGGGGSSFISGHIGCDAIDENLTHTGSSNHYSGYIFNNTVMIDGAGYSWTNVRGPQIQMPKPDGTLYSLGSGHVGHGYAKITYIPEEKSVFDFAYTGGYQTFTVPKSGNYKVELWGAQGGSTTSAVKGESLGGKGAYTSGKIYLNKGESLYFYIGQSGGDFSSSNIGNINFYSATFNGGGAGALDVSESSDTGEHGFPGGGATDVRLVNGAWNNTTSLRSRIMVAAGGGGGGWSGNGSGDQYYAGGGGAGGSLSGIGAPTATSSTPGTQTSGYAFGIGGNGIFGSSGNNNGTGGGGGGYYGGEKGLSFRKPNSSGSGGSSFISGHSGCNAINASGSHTGQPNHYSGHIFNETQMIDGNSSMPNPTGGTQIGHSGNGYARITYLP